MDDEDSRDPELNFRVSLNDAIRDSNYWALTVRWRDTRYVDQGEGDDRHNLGSL